jgi:uncharacterized protein (DUF4415 family)
MKRKKRVTRSRETGSAKIGSRRIARLKASEEVGNGSRATSGTGRRPVKKRVTLFLDADVLAWFREKPKYQTEINRALWKVMRKEGL